jgi:quinol monooxygenase YgiN
MIVVNAIVETSRENIDGLRDAITLMEILSREEAGCHDYTFSIELNNPNTLRITERWESLNDLQRHFRSAHMAEFQTAIASHTPLNIDISFYEATPISPALD